MISFLAYRLGQTIALSFPLKIAYGIAVFFSDVQYFFGARDRRIVFDNLKAIFPQKSDRELKRLRHAMIRNFAKYLVDFFRFSKIDKAYIEKHVKIENVRYLDEAIAEGRGVVVLTAHLGNWELGGAVMGVSGYPFWAVALSHKDKKVNDFFVSQREMKGIKVIPFGSSASRMCLKALRQKALLALVGDRDFSDKGIIADFFGKPTLFPEGPAVLPLLTGALVVPGFMFRNPDDSFTLHFDKSIEPRQTGDRSKDAAGLVEEYKTIFEGHIRQYPDQWYMFRRFWIA